MATPAVKRILVPLDGSPAAESIIPYAAGLAKSISAGIVLFQAISEQGESESVEDRLEEIAAGLRDSGMGVATDSAAGEPAKAIRDAARRYEAGLIVMTGNASVHGRRDLLGSTAHTVLRQCDVPVLVVPVNSAGWIPPAAIVFGHDGSENATEALDIAVTLAGALKTEITLVRAVTPVTGLGGAARYYNTGNEIAETDLKQIKNDLASSGLKVTTFVGKRPAEMELLGVAGSRPGAVIAVSTSSLSSEPNVLGSTTDRLVRSQTHPVLAIPAR